MVLFARTADVDGTRALGAAVSALMHAGDVVLLAGELGAGKTAFTQGFGKALGIDEPITSPSFTLARQYESGRLVLHHIDVYRLERISELQDIGVSELLDVGGVLVIEWGDVISPALPADYLEISLSYGEGDDDRSLSFRCVGDRWAARHRLLTETLALDGFVAMLVLGITTATHQVGCAIGGHEGVLASAHSARGKRHAETLAPTIDFLRVQARIELSEISAVAVDVGPGLFTGLRVGIAAAKAMAQALRVPMVPVSSLDLLAWPLRFSNKKIVACIDARRGEVFHATYLAVPGGVQRVTEPEVSTRRECAESISMSDSETVIVGDGAHRYFDLFDDLRKVDIAEQYLAHPSAASLVQLAHARAVREDFVPTWQIEPMYLRAPDAEINWSTRDGGG